MNIITDTSRAYHTPCVIQSLVITASFTAWVMMGVAIIVLLVVVVVIAVVLVAVVVAAALVALEVVLVVVMLVAVVMVLTVVARSLVCAGWGIGTLIEVLAFEIAMLGPSEAFRC